MQKLTLVMLFGDLGRFEAFATKRFNEAQLTGLFSEIIFVVNSYREGTEGKFIENLPSREIKLAFNSENNIPMGRNIGIQMSSNENIFIWDDDDSLHDPNALTEAYQFFCAHNLSLMEVPMIFSDGAPFHPQKIEVMPQIQTGLPDLVYIGMMHTPYFLKKEVWVNIPMPEYVPLRGDWLHWSALIWENNIPITCWTKSAVMVEGVRERSNGSTASGNGNGARLQALTSIITIFVTHHLLTGFDSESLLIKVRYFDKLFPDEKDMWIELVLSGKEIFGFNPSFELVGQAQKIVRQRLAGMQLKINFLKPYQAVMEM